MTAVDERRAERTTDKETGDRTYVYPPTGELLRSVTTIISDTDSKPWLRGWYGRSSMAWAVDNLPLIAKTLKATDDGREKAIALGENAAQQIRDLKADTGTYVHDVLEALILWAAAPEHGDEIDLPLLPEHLQHALYDEEPLTEVVDFMVTGFLNFVADFSPVFEATEMAVFNQPLGYAGTLDIIAHLAGYALSPAGDDLIAMPGSVLTPCIDAKSGKSPEGTWKEQLAAYRRSTECLPTRIDGVQPMPHTDCGMVLHLRPEYPDGYLLLLVAGADDEAAWARFESAARICRERQKVKGKPGKSVRPLRPDGTMPGPRICDLAGEGYGRALSPLSKALGGATELTELASFTADEVLAVPRIGPVLIETIRKMLADHGLSLADEKAGESA